MARGGDRPYPVPGGSVAAAFRRGAAAGDQRCFSPECARPATVGIDGLWYCCLQCCHAPPAKGQGKGANDLLHDRGCNERQRGDAPASRPPAKAPPARAEVMLQGGGGLA